MNLSFFEVHQPQSACTVDSVTVCVRVRVCARGAARACAYISLQVSCRDCIACVAHAGWRFENVCKTVGIISDFFHYWDVCSKQACHTLSG